MSAVGRLLCLVLALALVAGCASEPAAPEETKKVRKGAPNRGGADDSPSDKDVNYTLVGSQRVQFPSTKDAPPPGELSFEWPANATVVRVKTQFRDEHAGQTLPTTIGSSLLTVAGETPPTVSYYAGSKAVASHALDGGGINIRIGLAPDPIEMETSKPVDNETEVIKVRFSGWGLVTAEIEVEAGYVGVPAPE